MFVGYIEIQRCFLEATWVPLDFGVLGGPGINGPQSLGTRDDCNLNLYHVKSH